MDNHELAEKILLYIGGAENIVSATNCMTRVRFKIKDNNQVQLTQLKHLDGVLGVVEDQTLQVVVGPGKAKRIADMLIQEYGVKSTDAISN